MFGNFFKKVNYTLTFDPVILLLGSTQEKAYVHTKTYICQLYFERVKASNNPIVHQMWYIYTMEYHSAVKQNQLLMHTTWMKLKLILLIFKARP